MPKAADKRTRLVRAAAGLTHRRGFRETTLALVAREARIPLGNVYYYFRSKEEIAAAIIAERGAGFRGLLEEWSRLPAPRERLLAFVAMTTGNRDSLARDGCALGSLCTELNKAGGRVAENAATLLEEPLGWLEAEFRALGKGREARGLAIHLLSALQGLAVLANTLDDPEIVLIETKRLERWIREL